LTTSYALLSYATIQWIGVNGISGEFISNLPWYVWPIAYVLLAHVTISCMSISFHRYHTHQSITINRALDMLLQTELWLVTGMTKFDWVSVHRYHHMHSDQEKDPHSPVQKGFWRVFLLGVGDYVEAKGRPEVLRIRAKISGNAYERFISENSLLGPTILTIFWIIMFGPIWGSIAGVLCFSISPLFAVGGVNALAHYIGYRNHHTRDNSRNLGFLFPLNWIICGELDHNNHHKEQQSCSFRHKWYEFDIGYFYIRMAQKLGLMRIRHLYNTTSLKAEFLKQVEVIMQSDGRIKKRCEQLAAELNTSYVELQHLIRAKIEGKRVEMSRPLQELADEIYRTVKANYRLSLSY
jgi:stearoyl-CoA desaturase (delta-9 desaturase)